MEGRKFNAIEMASLRTSPYFPLEVDAFVSDEKLNECSAQANGVYIRILCLMHKSEDYGRIKLRTQGTEAIAEQLSRHLPFDIAEIGAGLEELLTAGVLYIDGGFLCQKRMIKDGQLSETRSRCGKLGMERRYASKAKKKATTPTEGKRYNAADFKKDLCSLGISEQTVEDWMANRKAKKLVPTKTAFEDTKRELLSHQEYTPEEQLKLAATKGWGGYKFKWFYNEITGNGIHENNSAGNSPVQSSREDRDYEESF